MSSRSGSSSCSMSYLRSSSASHTRNSQFAPYPPLPRLRFEDGANVSHPRLAARHPTTQTPPSRRGSASTQQLHSLSLSLSLSLLAFSSTPIRRRFQRFSSALRSLYGDSPFSLHPIENMYGWRDGEVRA